LGLLKQDLLYVTWKYSSLIDFLYCYIVVVFYIVCGCERENIGRELVFGDKD